MSDLWDGRLTNDSYHYPGGSKPSFMVRGRRNNYQLVWPPAVEPETPGDLDHRVTAKAGAIEEVETPDYAGWALKPEIVAWLHTLGPVNAAWSLEIYPVGVSERKSEQTIVFGFSDIQNAIAFKLRFL